MAFVVRTAGWGWTSAARRHPTLGARDQIRDNLHGGRGAGFQPFRFLGPVSWAVSPGWYEIAPLALGNWSGLDRLWLDGVSPMLFCSNWLRVIFMSRKKSGYLEGWKGCATKWGGLCRWVLTKDSSGFEDGRA